MINKKAQGQWKLMLGAAVFIMVFVALALFFLFGYDRTTEGVKDILKITEEDVDGDGVNNIADMCCCKVTGEIEGVKINSMGCPIMPPGKKLIEVKSCTELIGQEVTACKVIDDSSAYKGYS